MIAISNQPTGQTAMLPHGERLANLCPTQASLRGPARVNFHEHAPGTLSLVREHEEEVRPPSNEGLRLWLESSDFYYIATGRYAKGAKWSHSVVMHKGQFVHDPSPSGTFIYLDPEYLYFIYFIPNGTF